MTRSNKRQTYSKKSPRRWTSSVDIRCRKVNEIFQVFLFHKIFNSHSPMKLDITCMEPWVSGCIHPLIGGHCKVAHLCHKMWVCSFGGVWRFSLNIRPDHPQLLKSYSSFASAKACTWYNWQQVRRVTQGTCSPTRPASKASWRKGGKEKASWREGGLWKEAHPWAGLGATPPAVKTGRWGIRPQYSQ